MSQGCSEGGRRWRRPPTLGGDGFFVDMIFNPKKNTTTQSQAQPLPHVPTKQNRTTTSASRLNQYPA